MDHSQTVLYVLAFVLSLGVSAFFAGSETALVSLGRIDLQAMRETRRPARRHHPEPEGPHLAAARRHPDRPEPLPLGRLGLGDDAGERLVRRAVRRSWLAVLFSTVTLFIFAEMTPKAIAAASPVAVARAVAIPLSWMMKVLSPDRGGVRPAHQPAAARSSACPSTGRA